MNPNQLTLIQNGEFIVCDDVAYTPSRNEPTIRSGSDAVLTARAALPVNTMKAVFVRLESEIVPVPFLRSQERKVVSEKIRIEGALATRIAASLGLSEKLPRHQPGLGSC
jgi:hypothetical protein